MGGGVSVAGEQTFLNLARPGGGIARRQALRMAAVFFLFYKVLALGGSLLFSLRHASTSSILGYWQLALIDNFVR